MMAKPTAEPIMMPNVTCTGDGTRNNRFWRPLPRLNLDLTSGCEAHPVNRQTGLGNLIEIRLNSHGAEFAGTTCRVLAALLKVRLSGC